ncbi:MAG TPA: hypothetical protein VGF97_05360 [Rhizomicrobium sp.]|jgi:hypothetical protein
MRLAKEIPRYQSPFSTSRQIILLSHKYAATDEQHPITERDCLNAGEMIVQGTNERANLQIIFRWKLQAFERFPWVRDWPADFILDEELSHALIPARRVNLSDYRTICHALRTISSLPYVGVPVASAVLMAMYPADFTVIDRQAYKALKVKFCDPMPFTEYLAYLDFCRGQARKFDIPLRQYDQALWQLGSDTGRSRSSG